LKAPQKKPPPKVPLSLAAKSFYQRKTVPGQSKNPFFFLIKPAISENTADYKDLLPLQLQPIMPPLFK
jgi:hypothetical protein